MNRKEFTERKVNMLNFMEGPERIYYNNKWPYAKEIRVLCAYTRLLSNMWCHSTSLNESYNNVIKTFLNHQMSLHQAIEELIKTIQSQDQKDEFSNASNRIHRQLPSALGICGLRHLEERITDYAIARLTTVIHAAQETGLMTLSSVVLDITVYSRTCENLLRFNLP